MHQLGSDTHNKANDTPRTFYEVLEEQRTAEIALTWAIFETLCFMSSELWALPREKTKKSGGKLTEHGSVEAREHLTRG